MSENRAERERVLVAIAAAREEGRRAGRAEVEEFLRQLAQRAACAMDAAEDEEREVYSYVYDQLRYAWSRGRATADDLAVEHEENPLSARVGGIIHRAREKGRAEGIANMNADRLAMIDNASDAINAAREEGTATQTSELDDACAFLEPEKLVALLKKAPRGQSTWMISREIAPTLAEAIIATARALGWKPRAR